MSRKRSKTEGTCIRKRWPGQWDFKKGVSHLQSRTPTTVYLEPEEHSYTDNVLVEEVAAPVRDVHNDKR